MHNRAAYVLLTSMFLTHHVSCDAVRVIVPVENLIKALPVEAGKCEQIHI